MFIEWHKIGLIYSPIKKNSWEHSHAHVVSVDIIDDNTHRYIFSVRNGNNQCLPTYIDVDPNSFRLKSEITKQPIISLGEIGAFDDCGIMPTWLHREGNKRHLYYIGWTVRNTIPYHNSLGIAISTDGINYKKLFNGPILSANKDEPFFIGSSCILKRQEDYIMWYLSCVGWKTYDNKPEPFYDIKIAKSKDGINWEREGKTAIPLKENEGGISRPSVLFEDGIYKMWYSYRGKVDYRVNKIKSYRIGYAESSDGINWIRKDEEVGIDLSDKGWDSQMIEYPYVYNWKGKKIMIYNGNKFGFEGFGIALLNGQ